MRIQTVLYPDVLSCILARNEFAENIRHVVRDLQHHSVCVQSPFVGSSLIARLKLIDFVYCVLCPSKMVEVIYCEPSTHHYFLCSGYNEQLNFFYLLPTTFQELLFT